MVFGTSISSTVGDGLQLVLPWFASSSRDNLAAKINRPLGNRSGRGMLSLISHLLDQKLVFRIPHPIFLIKNSPQLMELQIE
jgi:hypothetical protein